ncbi:MAG: EAL domain-containing protein [Thermoleophilaceae bacterium]|nr:EAL domain-containing protein [Thermoleophilaceae bacterium]
MRGRTATRDAVEELLRAGELRSAYQPIVALDSLEPVGYEALARGPEGSALARPDQLFGAAAVANLSTEVDEACRHAAVTGALEAGLAAPATLFVNAEASTLDPSRRFLPDGEEAVRDGRLHVTVELTERALTARPRELFELVRWLRDRGFGVALDDVGVDDGSLALMPLIAPDVIKLDMSLTRRRPDADLARVVHAVQAEAERTGAAIVAEGIETDEHLARAIALGARYGQGWLFGRPGPLPERTARPTVPAPISGDPLEPPAPSPFSLVAARRSTIVGDKPLLLSFSRQLEARALELGREVVVLSTFQDARFFTPRSAELYRCLGEHAVLVGAFGVGIPGSPAAGVRGVALEESEALRGEWNVIVLAPHFAAAFVGRDLGDGGPDASRRFEFAITHDRGLVIEAARTLLLRTARAT